MEEKIEVTAKVTLDAITTLEDLERFVLTARQVLDHPEVMLVNNVHPAGQGAGRVGLVAVGHPKAAQPATSEPALTNLAAVPDRITEWPEDDTALRAYPWRDALGIVWRYGVPGREHGWSSGSSRAWKGLIYGPWHREEGAEVPDRIEEWPEDDEHLREHKWRDRDGYRWTWIVAGAQWECRDDITDKKTMTAGIPADGPWTREEGEGQ